MCRHDEGNIGRLVLACMPDKHSVGPDLGQVFARKLYDFAESMEDHKIEGVFKVLLTP